MIFGVPYTGRKSRKKIGEIMIFWQVAESSAGPNFTIPPNNLRIFSSSKSFKTVLSIRSSQKKGLRILHAASTKCLFFFHKSSVVGAEISGYRGTQKCCFSKGPWVGL